ncbi:hypothetical protein IFM89_016598 [Coptis chinensis]|uniref:Uncharacterized protein n=1 Tax=Coptis chinensis TaxID=261450 RepID=A0A835IWU1_9MAGN|nr:hypothetical protein IFM89_016598 [Coptis chinensis]
MEKVDKVKHPNVSLAVAFYCSKEEKLLVYEYQQNGSLFRLLHGLASISSPPNGKQMLKVLFEGKQQQKQNLNSNTSPLTGRGES